MLNFSTIPPGKFGNRPEQSGGLPGGCIVAEADPNRPRFQGPGAAVGQGRTVQAGPNRYALSSQKFRRFLAILRRQK